MYAQKSEEKTHSCDLSGVGNYYVDVNSMCACVEVWTVRSMSNHFLTNQDFLER